MKNVAVFGIYSSRIASENAVETLKREGFNVSDISVLFSSPEGTQKFAHQNATKVPEGATTGGVSGATLGGVLGWLAGIGSLAIPGVGPTDRGRPDNGNLSWCRNRWSDWRLNGCACGPWHSGIRS